MATDLTRRTFIGGAVAGSAGAALVGCSTGSAGKKPRPHPSTSTSKPQLAKADQVQRFVSRPDLLPPVVRITGTAPASSPGYILISPFYIPAPAKSGQAKSGKSSKSSPPGQNGAMVLRTNGDLVWFGSTAGSTYRMDLAAQTYAGDPVLTWYQGPIANGYGEGVGIIANSSYQQTHQVHAANGLKADLHELVLTPQGTALITVFRKRRADLSAVGGRVRGWALAGVVQEIDIATGQLLFEWDSLDHVAVTESHKAFSGGTAAKPYDYFHINSIAVAPDGDLIISGRHTWAIYKVSRPTGAVAWRLGGKRSDFKMGPGTHFYWQHHVRPQGSTRLSIFDDGAGEGAHAHNEKHSRAIVVDLDTTAMSCKLHQQFIHPGANVLAFAMGSAQVMPDGGMFVGWGTVPRFSLFAADGTLQLDGEIVPKAPSYRAFLADWTAQPTEPPRAAARRRASGGATVYATWNGATEVASWQVLAGTTPGSLTVAGSGRRSGFETAVAVSHHGPYFAAVARDSSGQELARSATIQLT